MFPWAKPLEGYITLLDWIDGRKYWYEVVMCQSNIVLPPNWEFNIFISKNTSSSNLPCQLVLFAAWISAIWLQSTAECIAWPFAELRDNSDFVASVRQKWDDLDTIPFRADGENIQPSPAEHWKNYAPLPWWRGQMYRKFPLGIYLWFFVTHVQYLTGMVPLSIQTAGWHNILMADNAESLSLWD